MKWGRVATNRKRAFTSDIDDDIYYASNYVAQGTQFICSVVAGEFRRKREDS
jgi:hypothetical protein